MFKNLTAGLLSLSYPHNCVLCKRYIPYHRPSIVLCPSCLDKIEFNTPPFCRKCSKHLMDPAQTFCLDCRHSEFHFDQSYSSALYNAPMRQLIHLFKYANKTHLRHPFRHVMSLFLKNYQIDLSSFDCIVPIPLHATRRRERGYNQAHLLAQSMSDELGIPLCEQNLVRVRPTQNQALIGRKDRWTNIQGAFKIIRPDEFFEKSVLIVDDLLTTGVTVSEAARTLKKAGAQNIGVFTLAIAV